jgi:hypothetical protein
MPGPVGAHHSSRFSLAVHDLRVSGGSETEDHLCRLQERFRLPLTVHLVFDQELSLQPGLHGFLRDNVAADRLELVFHGLSHACPRDVGRWSSFYHKHQAEYLLDDDALRAATGEVWEHGLSGFEKPIGICPPCWLATRTNWRFLESLRPLYLESTWRLRSRGRTIPSPIVSLGSPDPVELRGLRLLGSGLRRLGRIPGLGRVRVAIHTCDLERPDSMAYFERTIASLLSSGAIPGLQRDHLR